MACRGAGPEGDPQPGRGVGAGDKGETLFLGHKVHTLRLDLGRRGECSKGGGGEHGLGLWWDPAMGPGRLRPKSSPVNPEHVVQHLIEQNQGNIELFFVEDLQPRLDVISQFFLVHWDVVLERGGDSLRC